ncbi:MAG: hypothetical protein WD469_06655 [Paenibacillaceae bacterium]
MNSGYVTLIVLIAFGILLGSGWKDYFFKGYGYKTIVLFIAGWLICSFIKLPIYLYGKNMEINLAFIFLLFISGLLIIRKGAWVERLNIMTVSLILCLLDFTFREASGLALIYMAILMAFAAVCLQKSPTKQLACLLLGFLCSNVLSLFIHQRTQSFLLADQSYQDLWWLTVLLSRIFTGMYENVVSRQA